jgi:glycosyltransferase involved in cell wall biosynthesis
MTLLLALGGSTCPELDLIGISAHGAIRALAASQNIADRVRFLGHRTDVPKLIAGAQMGLLITNWEGFPRSILESMRAGLPVIGSCVGGIAESVQDGTTGYLVPRAAPEQLRQRIANSSAPALRARMGRAREPAEQEFGFDRMVERTGGV